MNQYETGRTLANFPNILPIGSKHILKAKVDIKNPKFIVFSNSSAKLVKNRVFANRAPKLLIVNKKKLITNPLWILNPNSFVDGRIFIKSVNF